MNFIDGCSNLNTILTIGWTQAVDAVMEGGVLSEEKYQALNKYRHKFGLHESDLDDKGHFSYFKRATLLKFVTHDGIVPRFDRKAARRTYGRIPFNLMRSEELVWLVSPVSYGPKKTADSGILGITSKYL